MYLLKRVSARCAHCRWSHRGIPFDLDRPQQLSLRPEAVVTNGGPTCPPFTAFGDQAVPTRAAVSRV